MAEKDIIMEIQSTISEIQHNEQIPNEQKTGIIYPVFKKEDIGLVSNYRGISLLDAAYKTLSMTLLRRLEVYAEDIVIEYQTGFKKAKVYNGSYLYDKKLMEKFYKCNKDLNTLLQT